MAYVHESDPGPLPIEQVAAKLGLSRGHIEPYGGLKAKLTDGALAHARARAPGKLILVTAMTPTRTGSGKTVTTIGLGQAFGRMGLSHSICLREPSLGPTLGIKGGGAGGDRSQLVPMDDINMHFTGDMHAVTAAHNFLAAMVDNHVHHGNDLDVDPEGIDLPRVVDLCDRQLRHVQLGQGGPNDGFAHASRFDITAASEVMAVLALASDMADLRLRLGRIVVARSRKGAALNAAQFGAVDTMCTLLQSALRPNLVQTLERTPALVHAGPFANIAHGCNSVIATRAALGLCDYVLSEAGFAADLGAEKFVHIKCRSAGLQPAAAVVVLTSSALRKHGGARKGTLKQADVEAVGRGLQNVAAHLEHLGRYGIPPVLCLNRFPGDSDEEIKRIRAFAQQRGVPFAISEAFARGGEGAMDLASIVRDVADAPQAPLRFLYEECAPLTEKIETLARDVYGADGVDYEPAAAEALARLQQQHGKLPICMAKTPYSLSHDPVLRGVPRDYRLQVRDAYLRAGAGFIVVLTGAIVTMPGMPKNPRGASSHS